jgi:ABC-type sugar transport system ATPase subunit
VNVDPAAPPALEATAIVKRFDGVHALNGARLDVRAGEIHALLGENGAGKSTLVKIITGLHSSDEGGITLDGEQLTTRKHAAQGTAVVYQDLALVESLDIATNLALGQLPTRFGILDRKRMRREASEILTSLKVRVTDVTTPVGLLSGGQRQIIAIARAMRQNKPLLLLDEPTAALGVQETRHVGELIDELKPSGKAIVCVSHDLEFVFAHADRVTVLRLGRSVGTRRITETDRSEIVGMITGAIAPSATEDAA